MSTSVKDFFENYGAALTSFSAEKISSFYQTPLAIYSDQGTQTVSEMSEVVSFWEQGIGPYKKMGIERANPRVLSEEQLSETILISKVLWINYDAAANEVSNETNFYILSKVGDEYKISGLIIMTK